MQRGQTRVQEEKRGCVALTAGKEGEDKDKREKPFKVQRGHTSGEERDVGDKRG